MALTVVGNIAVEWEKVYAIKVSHSTYVELYVDVQGLPPRRDPIMLRDAEYSKPVLQKLDSESRLRKFGDPILFAVDINKVLQVAATPDGSWVIIDLGDGRSDVVAIDSKAALAMLEYFEKPLGYAVPADPNDPEVAEWLKGEDPK